MDFHVLVMPALAWRRDLRIVYSVACLESASAGFIRLTKYVQICSLSLHVCCYQFTYHYATVIKFPVCQILPRLFTASGPTFFIDDQVVHAGIPKTSLIIFIILLSIFVTAPPHVLGSLHCLRSRNF